MADTKEGREDQADNEQRRQRERDMAEARTRSDEAEPPADEGDEPDEAGREEDEYLDSTPECHRRGCDESATFVVLERYQEDTGHGAVEAEVVLCGEHAAEESPTNLDGVYEDYVFRVDPILKTRNADAE